MCACVRVCARARARVCMCKISKNKCLSNESQNWHSNAILSLLQRSYLYKIPTSLRISRILSLRDIFYWYYTHTLCCPVKRKHVAKQYKEYKDNLISWFFWSFSGQKLWVTCNIIDNGQFERIFDHV